MYKVIKINHNNKLQCKKCEGRLESKAVYDMKWYKCGVAAADGGNEYLRKTGYDENIIELSKYDVEE